MEKLSGDLLFSIFQELDAKTLCVVSQVSKDFNAVADSDVTWVSVHGFTRYRSLEILSELKVAISKFDEALSIAVEVEIAAGLVYFRRDTGRDADAEALARANFESAHQIWKATKLDLAKATQDLSIAYQMLRVPVRLRLAAASANSDYYFTCRVYNASGRFFRKLSQIEICGVDAARIHLTKLDREVTSLMDLSELAKATTFWWGAVCCARSPWATKM